MTHRIVIHHEKPIPTTVIPGEYPLWGRSFECENETFWILDVSWNSQQKLYAVIDSTGRETEEFNSYREIREYFEADTNE